MKLTRKDHEFLARLHESEERHDVSVLFRETNEHRLVLQQPYGTKVHRSFRLTRQAMHWRFNRIMNEIYVNAYLTILAIESRFGTHLRQAAMAIARQRYEQWNRMRPSWKNR